MHRPEKLTQSGALATSVDGSVVLSVRKSFPGAASVADAPDGQAA